MLQVKQLLHIFSGCSFIYDKFYSTGTASDSTPCRQARIVQSPNTWFLRSQHTNSISTSSAIFARFMVM